MISIHIKGRTQEKIEWKIWIFLVIDVSRLLVYYNVDQFDISFVRFNSM